MKIAHIIPHWSPFLYDKPVGIKKLVKTLTDEQIKKGHDVTIIAPRGSSSPHAKLIETIAPLKSMNISIADYKSYVYGYIHAAMAAQKTESFDVIHSHMDYMFVPFIPKITRPVVATIHGVNFTPEEQFIFQSFYGQFHAVGISKQVEKLNTYIRYETTVYNGVDLTDMNPSYETDQDALLWIGRFNRNKGLAEAVQLSSQTQKRLNIIGFSETGNESYFDSIMPTINQNPLAHVVQNQLIDDQKKIEYYRQSRIFLFPIQWEEPFGLVMTEAMACGTPVVAFARGSVPEVIKDGVTGFIINPSDDDIRGDYTIKKTGLAGMQEAIERIYALSPNAYKSMRMQARRHVEEHFSAERMADGYAHFYSSLL